MIEHTITRLNARLAGTALLALLLSTLFAPAAGATPVPRDPCAQALAYEKFASQDLVAAQARYDSSVAGLGANARCNDQQMRLVNEAYLLSMRAPAEHDLRIGNWERDLTRANSLLTECTGFPGLARTRVADDCRTQIQNNQRLAGIYAAQAARFSGFADYERQTAGVRTIPVLELTRV